MAQVEADDIRAFRAALVRVMGLRFPHDSDGVLREVLQARLQANSNSDVDAYLTRLCAGSHEEEELAKALCVNETYFMRNSPHFAVLEEAVHGRAAAGRRYLRILSAGCSSGEETYSLAIMLRMTLPDLPSWDISILGIDVDPDAIAKARTARYSKWSLRDTPEAVRRRYFNTNGSEHVVRDEVRQMVRFDRRNLTCEDAQLWRAEAWDVVFCRNVLMYFDRDVAQGIVDRFAHALAPGGLLFLGHAETLRGLSSAFDLHQSHQTFFYARHGRADRPFVSGTTAPSAQRVEATSGSPRDSDGWYDVIADSSRRVAGLTSASAPRAAQAPGSDERSTFERALQLMEQERFDDALAALAQASSSDEQTERLLLRAALLVTRGDVEAATSACQELLKLDEMSAGAHYVMALCRDNHGDSDAAVEHDRIATYLDSEFAMPHLHIGLLAKRSGDEATARRELGVALTLLASERPERVVLFGGGFSRDALMNLCRSQLQSGEGQR